MQATAIAHPNVALIKYWGKRDRDTNLPAVGSLSLTLSGLETRTTIWLDKDSTEDQLVLNGQPDSSATARATKPKPYMLLAQTMRNSTRPQA